MHRYLEETEHLIGQGAEQLLESAIMYSGGRLGAWSIPFHERSPDGGFHMVFEAEVWWDPSDADSQPETERFGLYSRSRGEPFNPDFDPRSVVLTNGAIATRVWRFPYDPWLPALPAMVDPLGLRETLADLGIDLTDHEADEEPHVTVVSYRGRRRAVIQIDFPDRTYFAKVTREEENTTLITAHRVLNRAGVPVARVLAADTGLHVLQKIAGTELFTELAHHGPDAVDFDDLLHVVEQISEVDPGELAVGPVPPHHDWLESMFETASRGAPRLIDRLNELVDRLSPLLDEVTEIARRNPVLIHGDFHAEQLFVADRRLVGIVDLDDLRVGRTSEDLGAFLGYLSVRCAKQDGGADEVAQTPLANAVRSAFQAFSRAADTWELAAMCSLWALERMTMAESVQFRGWQPDMERALTIAENWCEIAVGAKTIDQLWCDLESLPTTPQSPAAPGETSVV